MSSQIGSLAWQSRMPTRLPRVPVSYSHPVTLMCVPIGFRILRSHHHENSGLQALRGSGLNCRQVDSRVGTTGDRRRRCGRGQLLLRAQDDFCGSTGEGIQSAISEQQLEAGREEGRENLGGNAEGLLENRGEEIGIGRVGLQLPTQLNTIVSGMDPTPMPVDNDINAAEQLMTFLKLQEGKTMNIAIFGTRNLPGFGGCNTFIKFAVHQMMKQGNHVYTSGGGDTNMAVIQGALAAELPEQLTVILPQSLEKQPEDIRDDLLKVTQIVEMPENDNMQLADASRICYEEIISKVEWVIIFLQMDSTTLLEVREYAKSKQKVVTPLFVGL